MNQSMKTQTETILFASDLDGTLLNDAQSIAPAHVEILNRLEEKGCLFTVATARSPASARQALDPVGLRLSAPAVCLNGSLLWDMTADKPVKAFPIASDASDAVRALFSAYDASGTSYALDAVGRLVTYYRDDIALQPQTEAYLRELQTPETPVLPMRMSGQTEILSFSFYDHVTRLDGLAEALRQIPGLKTVYYADTYLEGYRFLECGASDAGKGTGARAAQQAVHAGQLYVFGDNFNDVDMYRCADKSFAPVNGEPEMQKIATHVIPSNNDGGVIQTIQACFEAAARSEN